MLEDDIASQQRIDRRWAQATDPTEEDFHNLFCHQTNQMGLEGSTEMVDYLIEKHFKAEPAIISITCASGYDYLQDTHNHLSLPNRSSVRN